MKENLIFFELTFDIQRRGDENWAHFKKKELHFLKNYFEAQNLPTPYCLAFCQLEKHDKFNRACSTYLHSNTFELVLNP